MSTDDSTRMRDLVRPKSSIMALIEAGNVEPASAATDPGHQPTTEPGRTPLPATLVPLPQPGDPYKAHARNGNGPEMTLHFVLKDFSYEGFAYANVERVRLVASDRPGGGLALIVRFTGSVVTEMRVEGRHLHSLYHFISLHIVPWVWELPSGTDIKDRTTTVITAITITHPAS